MLAALNILVNSNKEYINPFSLTTRSYQEQYEKYFEFGDIKNPETSVKVLFDSKNLSIVAETYLRPAIYDHDPINQITGTDRDQAIRIFITPGIDEKTLYYTDDEKADIEKKGYKMLDAGNLKNHKYYGYWEEGKEDSIVYKNVRITNRADVNENLLKHYGAPYIQDEKGTVVVIPPNKGNLPPEYKEILVWLLTIGILTALVTRFVDLFDMKQVAELSKYVMIVFFIQIKLVIIGE